ncbi:MAG: hypothetical protein ACT4O3_00090 [Elusimicrobiota bacterium]
MMDRIIFLPSVVVASVGLLASVITASLTYYFTKKHQLKMEERRLKEESYRKFIKALSDMALDNSEKNRMAVADIWNSMLLVAHSDVLKRWQIFHQSFKPNIDYRVWPDEQRTLFTELIRAMRADLLGDKSDIPTIQFLTGKKT